MSAPQLAIVGGGPAGLVAAIAARQAGFAVTVLEQAAGFEKIGGAVGIQSNGLRVLRAIGILDEFQKHIELVHQAGLEAPPGRRLTYADFRELRIPESGFAVALRYDLQTVLYQSALDHGVDIQFNTRCASIERFERAITLRVGNRDAFKAELVLGCDGVRSAVRQSGGFSIDRREPGEAYLRCIANVEHPDRARVGEFWQVDGRRVGAFPLPGQRTYLFCSVPVGRWRDLLANHLSMWIQSWNDFGEPVRTLMAAVDWPRAVYDELSEVRVDQWHRDRVFLVGDSAHAMTPNLGQGANCAMVDALVLVNLLAEARPTRNWNQAGQKYERMRKPFVTRIQDVAWLGGRLASWKSKPARAMRDAFLRLGDRVGPLRRSSMLLAAGYNPLEQEYLRAP